MRPSTNFEKEMLCDIVQRELDDAREYIQYCKENTDETHLISLFYYPEEREWLDENGEIIYVPQALVPKVMIDIFMHQQSYFYGTRFGGSLVIELFWVDDPPWKEESV